MVFIHTQKKAKFPLNSMKHLNHLFVIIWHLADNLNLKFNIFHSYAVKKKFL